MRYCCKLVIRSRSIRAFIRKSRWYRWGKDSNLKPLRYELNALPIELLHQENPIPTPRRWGLCRAASITPPLCGSTTLVNPRPEVVKLQGQNWIKYKDDSLQRRRLCEKFLLRRNDTELPIRCTVNLESVSILSDPFPRRVRCFQSCALPTELLKQEQFEIKEVCNANYKT